MIETLVLITFFQSQRVDASARFEFGYGIAHIAYDEAHKGQASKDVAFSQQSMLFNTAFRAEILGKWVTFNSEFSALAPAFGTSLTDHDAMVFDLNNIVYFNLPARPFNLVVSMEYFYHKLKSSLPTFGYKDMLGQRFCAILNLKTPSKRLQLEVRYPFYNSIAGRSELFAEVYFNLTPLSSGDGLLQFSTRQYIKLGYASSTTEFEGALPITISVKSFTLSWVGSW